MVLTKILSALTILEPQLHVFSYHDQLGYGINKGDPNKSFREESTCKLAGTPELLRIVMNNRPSIIKYSL